MTDDFFRSRLDQMIDHSHPLAVLASRLAWEKMESRVAPLLAHRVRPLRTSEEAPDLAGAVVRVSAGSASNAGRPRLDTRLMIALTLLKNSFDLSDEELVQRFAENVYWQYFAGFEYFDPRPPCDATQIGRFRCTLGEAGLEELLSATIHTAVDVGAVKKSELQRVIVNTTVQEKAVAHPVDSPLAGDRQAQAGGGGQTLWDCSQTEKGTNRSQFFRGQVDKYTWVDIGSSYLPGDIITAFLWAQMEEADAITRRRLELWNAYHQAFAAPEADGRLRRPVVPAHCEHNAHMYYLLLPSLERRTAFIDRLRQAGIHTVFHYIPLHSAPAGLRHGRAHGDLAVTADLSDRLVRLPLWLGLAERQDEVIRAVTKALE